MTEYDVPAVLPGDWRHDAVLELGGLPDRLADAARQAGRELSEGKPGRAVQVLDQMIADVESWRRIASEQANEDDDVGLP